MKPEHDFYHLNLWSQLKSSWVFLNVVLKKLWMGFVVGYWKEIIGRRDVAFGGAHRDRYLNAGMILKRSISRSAKATARILASPRALSCVLNHFPVDSAVCNPIIGVSPPGKLLFYSRTSPATGVSSHVHWDMLCNARFQFTLPPPFPFLYSQSISNFIIF